MIGNNQKIEFRLLRSYFTRRINESERNDPTGRILLAGLYLWAAVSFIIFLLTYSWVLVLILLVAGFTIISIARYINIIMIGE